MRLPKTSPGYDHRGKDVPPLKPRHPAREMPRLATEERKGLAIQWPFNSSAYRAGTGGRRKKAEPQGKRVQNPGGPTRPPLENGHAMRQLERNENIARAV